MAQLVQSVMLHQYFNKVFHVAMQVYLVARCAYLYAGVHSMLVYTVRSE